MKNISLPLTAMNPALEDSFVPNNRIIELPEDPSISSPMALDPPEVQLTQHLRESESGYKRAEDIQVPPPPMKNWYKPLLHVKSDDPRTRRNLKEIEHGITGTADVEIGDVMHVKSADKRFSPFLEGKLILVRVQR
jgi:hypothetical protein